jgi:hypothetical protein
MSFIILKGEEEMAQFVRDSDPWLWNNVVEDLEATTCTLVQLSRIFCRELSLMTADEKRACRENLRWSLYKKMPTEIVQ